MDTVLFFPKTVHKTHILAPFTRDRIQMGRPDPLFEGLYGIGSIWILWILSALVSLFSYFNQILEILPSNRLCLISDSRL